MRQMGQMRQTHQTCLNCQPSNEGGDIRTFVKVKGLRAGEKFIHDGKVYTKLNKTYTVIMEHCCSPSTETYINVECEGFLQFLGKEFIVRLI